MGTDILPIRQYPVKEISLILCSCRERRSVKAQNNDAAEGKFQNDLN